ncbi:MAG: methyl-accepting chemotaxis protein [Lachnospiraceae bacterium]
MSRKKENKQETAKRTGLPLRSIKTKMIILGGVALVTTLVLGITGIQSLNKNHRSSQLTSDINNINLLQNENKTLDMTFLYQMDNTYNQQIVENLQTMQKYATDAQKYKSGVDASDLKTIGDDIQKTTENMNQMVSLITERGFAEGEGVYAKFFNEDKNLEESFDKMSQEADWIDGTWVKIEMSTMESVQIDGKKYRHYHYDAKIPSGAKRDYIVVRAGGNGPEYKGRIYFTNIIFDKDTKVDLSKLKESDLSLSYGNALHDMKVDMLGGEPSISYAGEYSGATQDWQEASIEIPVVEYPVQDYKRVSFDIYYEETKDLPLMQMAACLNEKYKFDEALEKINADFASYSMLVVEGSDTSETLKKLLADLQTALENVDLYTVDEEAVALGEKGFQTKLDEVNSILETDQQIQNLKIENNALNENLTKATSDIKKSVEESGNLQKASMTRLIITVIVVGLVGVFILTVYVSRSVQYSIRHFKDTLKEIEQGRMTVKADTKRGDEFDTIGRSLNHMTDTLTETLRSVGTVSRNVQQSGSSLKGMAENTNQISNQIDLSVTEIAKGATDQANDVEQSTSEITELGNLMDEMVGNIGELDATSSDMKHASDEAVHILEQLGNSNEKMTDGVHKIAQQIHATNESVQKIKEAITMISSIASQTNLLSLNASIEAARAGDAGKGFAVVATEISQLADQSDQSATSIDQIITRLTSDFEQTMKVMQEVELATKEQNEKLSETQHQFEIVSDGITQSRTKTEGIKHAIESCNEVRLQVNQLMLNLSAISEENAASTTETAEAMRNLNDTINHLLEESDKLLAMSGQLEQDLKFFQL